MASKLLGMTFEPLSEADWLGYSGAEEGTLIARPAKDVDVLLSPDRKTLTVFDYTRLGEHGDDDVSHWVLQVETGR